MIHVFLASAMTAALSTSSAAIADSTVYPVYNHERVAGSMVVKRSGDTTSIKYVYTDRNRGSRTLTRMVDHLGKAVSREVFTILPDETIGASTLRVDFSGDSIRRVSRTDTTRALNKGNFYPLYDSPYDVVQVAQYLLRQPGYKAILSNGDTASVRIAIKTTVRVGARTETLRFVSLRSSSQEFEQSLWIDANDEIFATEVGWFMAIRPGVRSSLPVLRKAEFKFRDAEAEAINKKVLVPTNGIIAIRNGDLFDSESGTVKPRTTVIVRGDRIVAVGPAESTEIPTGATVIDATGKTLMPGMWEMHGHLALESQSYSGPAQLSYGITTVRDLASDIDVAVANRERAQAGLIAAPREILAGFIEGMTKWAGPTATLVATEAEARGWVARYDSLGYKQVKLYNVVHPDLVPSIIEEAHKRGMRVSGHIPRGLSVPAAVQLGFDEINHAAFLFSTFYQDSLYIPRMRAYSQVATAVAPIVDVDGQAMTDLIKVLKTHNTVIDGTFAVWIQSAGTDISSSVGAGVSPDAAKADANYLRLIKRLYDAGVTLVAGTDAFASPSYDTELELYEKVGIPAATVLQIATIIPARVMKEDKDYGSISVGKVADLFIVNGKPHEKVSDIRKVEQVIRGGRMFNADALRKAALVKP
ncbi:MAG: amidohydrolase family protein [Gemmatimonadaceae bacterium]